MQYDDMEPLHMNGAAVEQGVQAGQNECLHLFYQTFISMPQDYIH